MALETELALFNQRRATWCVLHEGKYVTIQDDTVLGPFDDWETGVRAGYKAFGVLRPFLVKEICEVDRVIFIGAAA